MRRPIGDPLEPGTLVGPLIDGRAFGMMRGRAIARGAPEGGRSSAAAHGGRAPRASTSSPASVGMPAQTGSPPRRPSRRSSTCSSSRPRRGDRDAQRRAAGLSSAIFTERLREAERFLAPRAATAASPTSTSAPGAPRSAAPSAARRRPAAAASPAPTRGRPTCAARPAPSTGDELPLAQGVEFDASAEAGSAFRTS